MRRVDIEAALTERESMGVDPFVTGFGHKKDQKGLNLNSSSATFGVCSTTFSKSFKNSCLSILFTGFDIVVVINCQAMAQGQRQNISCFGAQDKTCYFDNLFKERRRFTLFNCGVLMDAKTNYQASAGKPKHLFQGNGFRKQEIMNMLQLQPHLKVCSRNFLFS